jgi:glycosyltransferase involved in cell wall biosynthesis
MRPLPGIISPVLRTSRILRRPIRLRALPPRPLVSVLMINFNYARYIEQAIRSVLDQTYTDLELVVVDDVSTDASIAIVERIRAQDARVQLHLRERNGRMAAATNTAYGQANGEILCLLDSDDWFHPDKVQRVVSTFQERPATGFIVHPMVISSGTAEAIQIMPFLANFEQGWIEDRVRRRGGRWQGMPTSALSMRRDLARLLFPLPEEALSNSADGFMYTLAPLLTEVAAIEEPLSHYRVHDHNAIASHRRDLDRARKETDIFARHIRSANRRLEELGLPELSVDLSRNLNFQRSRMLEALHRPDSRRRLLQRWLHLSRLLAKDDLFRPLQRGVYIAVFGIAVLLPAPMRAWWLDRLLGFNRVKRHLGRFVTGVRQFGRRRVRPAA